MADNIKNLYLPAEITGIYAYGSILRQKEHPGDLDLIITYTQTKEQVERWETFKTNFSNAIGMNDSFSKISKKFVPYQAKGIAFSDAIKNEKLSKLLLIHGIEPAWASCFTWYDVLGHHTYGFSPRLNEVLRKMIFGKSRGFQITFKEGSTLPDGCVDSVIENRCLAWSQDKPDVKTNLLGRSKVEKLTHNRKELEHFLKTEIPRHKSAYVAAKELTLQRISNLNIELNFENLENKHVEIQNSGNESVNEFAEKLELGRNEIHKYKNETAVLEIISVFADGSFNGYSTEEYLALRVMYLSRRKRIPEDSAREILHTLGLPEDRIVTITKCGLRTDFKLAKSDEEKTKLIAEAESEKRRLKKKTLISKVARSFDSRAKVYLTPTGNATSESLMINISMDIEKLEKKEVRIIQEDLQKKGFTINLVMTQFLEASKSAILKSTESNKELRAITKNMMTKK
jgi:hypothetical protein